MKLFDDFERHDDSPALYAEPHFAFLNHSARAVFANTRDILDTWFARYAIAHQADLRAAFRSRNDVNHRSAFFELFLHELLLRLGCVVTIHPNVSGTTRRPDFLVTSPSGARFYLEAVLATGESAQDAAARARMNQVYDALNRMPSPNFFIGMNLRGAPRTAPPERKIRSFLEARLVGLDPDEMYELQQSKGIAAMPRWPYEYEGWKIEFYPIPKSPDARGKTGIRPLGVRFEGFRWVKSREAIRDAVIAKARRYGDLGLPYVVAVNAVGEYGVDRDEVIDALFGQEELRFSITPSGPSDPETTRALDGAWTSPLGPKWTRVSAILLAGPVLPWNVPRASICLYHNPWAKRPYTSELNRLPRAVVVNGRVEWQEGESLAIVFGLPEGWPEEKP